MNAVQKSDNDVPTGGQETKVLSSHEEKVKAHREYNNKIRKERLAETAKTQKLLSDAFKRSVHCRGASETRVDDKSILLSQFNHGDKYSNRHNDINRVSNYVDPDDCGYSGLSICDEPNDDVKRHLDNERMQDNNKEHEPPGHLGSTIPNLPKK